MSENRISALMPSPDHPVAAEVAAISARISALCEMSPLSMDEACAGDLLCELPRLRTKVAALEVAVLDHARTVEVGASSGARSTHDWWAHQTKMTSAEAGRVERLRSRLTAEVHQPLLAALIAGRLLLDQGAGIVNAVDELRRRAQSRLLDLAADLDAKALRPASKRLLDVIAPDLGEAHEARILERRGRSPSRRVLHVHRRRAQQVHHTLIHDPRYQVRQSAQPRRISLHRRT